MMLSLRAFSLLTRNFRLLALAFFPGTVTFLASLAAVYYSWSWFLSGHSLWIELPSAVLIFFLVWLVVGNLALLPVEDAIIDEVQKVTLGSVSIPAPKFSFRRVLRQFGFSLVVGFVTLVLFFASFVPGTWPITIACAAWITAYGFLSALYERSAATWKQKWEVFKKDWLANLGLGFFLNVLLFVPVVNVFLLGYAQILSTLVFLERRKRAISKF